MIVISAICGRCGKTVTYDHVAKVHIIRWLRKKGWSFGKLHLCPNCNGRNKRMGESSNDKE